MDGFKSILSTGLKILIVLVVIGAAIRLWPKETVEVGVVSLSRGDVRDVVTPISSGTVKADRYARVRASAIGDVERIAFHKGDRVRKGDLVLKLKNREHRARLELSRANLAAGGASRRQATLRSEQVAKAWDRTRKLFDQKIASESSLEQVETEKSVSGEVINAADANLAQLRAAVEISEAAYDATFMRAPFDGVIASVTPEEGEALSPGLPVYEIYDDATVKIEAAVDEVDAAKLRPGMPVVITTDALPGMVIDATLAWIAPLVTHDLKGSRNVDITIELLRSEAQLKVGMSVDVEIVVAKHTGVPYLPTGAVMGKGTGRTVLVVQDGVAVERPVKAGLFDWEMTEIADGVAAADKIIFTLNAPGLAAGARVRVNPALTPAKGR